MKPAAWTLAFFCLVLLAQSRAAWPAEGPHLRDDLQHEVAIEPYPHRIVSLLPSLTEVVCALQACDRLVATDRYSNWPAEVAALPKAGGLEDAAIETIVALHPDLVLLSRSQRIDERLDALKIRRFAIGTDGYADIARSITLVGELLGIEDRAAELNRAIERGVREGADRARLGRRGRSPAVYFEVDAGPYAAGPASFIGELLTRLGVRNIVTADLGPYPKLNPEYVVRRDPDVIFIAPADAALLDRRPGWRTIGAVREHRICSFPAEVRDTLVRPGPRVVQAIDAMADCLDRVWP